MAKRRKLSLSRCCILARAVPEDSEIFRYCEAGNSEDVKRLLWERRASVHDTSPNGWKPLHVGHIHRSVSKHH